MRRRLAVDAATLLRMAAERERAPRTWGEADLRAAYRRATGQQLPEQPLSAPSSISDLERWVLLRVRSELANRGVSALVIETTLLSCTHGRRRSISDEVFWVTAEVADIVAPTWSRHEVLQDWKQAVVRSDGRRKMANLEDRRTQLGLGRLPWSKPTVAWDQLAHASCHHLDGLVQWALGMERRMADRRIAREPDQVPDTLRDEIVGLAMECLGVKVPISSYWSEKPWLWRIVPGLAGSVGMNQRPMHMPLADSIASAAWCVAWWHPSLQFAVLGSTPAAGAESLAELCTWQEGQHHPLLGRLDAQSVPTSIEPRLSPKDVAAEYQHWFTGAVHTANRAALIVSGDFAATYRMLDALPAAFRPVSVDELRAELIDYALSPEYLEQRAHLGLAR